MLKLLPVSFLIAFCALFGISWIIVGVDPDTAPWYIFALLVFLIFIFFFNFLGIVLYFLRTRLVKNYDKRWYFRSSYKMSLFISLFIGLLAALSILQLVTILTLLASMLIVGLLAVWVYLGKSK